MEDEGGVRVRVGDGGWMWVRWMCKKCISKHHKSREADLKSLEELKEKNNLQFLQSGHHSHVGRGHVHRETINGIAELPELDNGKQIYCQQQ